MPARESTFWIKRKARLDKMVRAILETQPHVTLPQWDKIGAAFGVSADAARVKWYQMRNRTDAPDPIESEEKRHELLRQRRQEREDLEAIAGEKSLRRYLETLVRDTAQRFPPPPLPRKPVASARRSAEETLILSLNDWHAYERVSSARTRGLNEYDAPIMGRRVRQVIDTGLSIKDRMERGGGWRFPRCLVALNGDFISGTIHEVERFTDAPSLVHAVYGTGLVLAQALRDIAGAFESVEVFSTPGNHGRLPDARRVNSKDPWRSWDTMIALYAREHLRSLKNVRFFIPDAFSVAYDVEGWRFLQSHGHNVRSWMSIPYYGLNRMTSTINALEASRQTPIHYFLCAHFHQTTNIAHPGGELFVSGSLIGGTEHSVEGIGRADRPSQLMLGVHRRHGVTHRWPLLADAPVDGPSYDVAPWVSAA